MLIGTDEKRVTLHLLSENQRPITLYVDQERSVIMRILQIRQVGLMKTGHLPHQLGEKLNVLSHYMKSTCQL